MKTHSNENARNNSNVLSAADLDAATGGLGYGTQGMGEPERKEQLHQEAYGDDGVHDEGDDDVALAILQQQEAEYQRGMRNESMY